MSPRFRARRSFGGRRWRPRQRVRWITDVFNGTSLSLTVSVPTELSMVEGDDWMPTGPIVRRNIALKRVLVKGVVNVTPALTALERGPFAFFWALHVIDLDDSDSDIVTGAQFTIMQAQRVLQCGVIGGVAIEGTTAYTGIDLLPALQVDVDWRGTALMRPDDVLLMSFQPDATQTAVLTSAAFHGYARSLVTGAG